MYIFVIFFSKNINYTFESRLICLPNLYQSSKIGLKRGHKICLKESSNQKPLKMTNSHQILALLWIKWILKNCKQKWFVKPVTSSGTVLRNVGYSGKVFCVFVTLKHTTIINRFYLICISIWNPFWKILVNIEDMDLREKEAC